MLTIRVDDVSLQTDIDKLSRMVGMLRERDEVAAVILGYSIFSNNTEHEPAPENERLFPKIWNTHSSLDAFFQPDTVGIPLIEFQHIPAAHGLFHIDHRLLTEQLQHASVLASCSLLNTNQFIPPFNKVTPYMEELCREHEIEIISFSTGNWKHLKYQKYDGEGLWYFHTHDFTLESFQKAIE